MRILHIVTFWHIILGAPFFDNHGGAMRHHILTFSARICWLFSVSSCTPRSDGSSRQTEHHQNHKQFYRQRQRSHLSGLLKPKLKCILGKNQASIPERHWNWSSQSPLIRNQLMMFYLSCSVTRRCSKCMNWMKLFIANHQGLKLISCLVHRKRTAERENSSGTDLVWDQLVWIERSRSP